MSKEQVSDVCAYCGCSFIKKLPNQKYCSRKCYKKETNLRKKLKRGAWDDKTCIVCGTTYTPVRRNQNTCSETCAKKRKYIRVMTLRNSDTGFTDNGPRICIVCGKTFVPKRRSSVTCSAECHRKLTRTPWLQTKRKSQTLKAKEDEYLYYSLMPDYIDENAPYTIGCL